MYYFFPIFNPAAGFQKIVFVTVSFLLIIKLLWCFKNGWLFLVNIKIKFLELFTKMWYLCIVYIKVGFKYASNRGFNLNYIKYFQMVVIFIHSELFISCLSVQDFSVGHFLLFIFKDIAFYYMSIGPMSFRCLKTKWFRM